MIEEAVNILDAIPSDVAVRQARFAEVRAGVAYVDMGDSRFVAEFGAGFVPRVGETVQILSVGRRHLMFPARALPGTGTVMTVSSGLAKVQTAVGEVSMPYIGTAPVSGDLVGISWSEQPFVIGKLSVQPDAPEPIPDPGGGAVRSATFMATDTGSTDRGQSRWWQAQPWASNTTYGAWFYGTQIRDTITAGASLVSLEFYVSWVQRQGGDPRFALHNLASKSGVPAMGTYTPWAPGSGWQTPPMAQAWFDALKAGGSALGVGLNQGGYNKFSSRAQNAMSGALRISWRV
ncbi:MAG: hypothetical protein BGN97_03760 [Microbacterium sp. 69-10]|uniref:hypothetical protein n=1 Tax=Microbacterium sp. 69-10 TaxID=1895783 RepID=UPI00095BDBA7|nr:hypothetical protein [Microbacterium sp. 69-10]OJU41827.1 MAG: hypothetical protein BGN97_03760 [Microbacterium sp. 69-10]